MSDDAEPEAPSTPPAPKPPMVVVALLALNLLLTGAGLFLAFTRGRAAHAATPPAEPTTATTPPREVTGPLVTLDPFVVNLDEPGASRYLKVQLQVEVVNAAAAKVFEKSKQLIRDDLLSYLSSLKVAATQGAASKDQIRSHLHTAIGEVIGEDRVRRVVFIEFVVQ